MSKRGSAGGDRPSRAGKRQRTQESRFEDEEDEIQPAPRVRRRRAVEHVPGGDDEVFLQANGDSPKLELAMNAAMDQRREDRQVVEEEAEEEEEEEEDGKRDEDNEEAEEESGGEDEEEVRELVRLNAKKGFSHAGILHSVRLDRFMSHDCFQYDLGPNMNIVHGPNGSGKSAIVAALQVGLMGRVGLTERGKNLEDLIKHDCEDCVITIKILNRKPPVIDGEQPEPDFSYKHEIYGDFITIERRISRVKGRGGYALKVGLAGKRNAKLGKDVTSRQEVRAIVDYFGFKVDNPVAILTQTKSKEFLSKGKPTGYYNLFLEATLLGPIEEELGKIERVTMDARALLASREENFPAAEKDLRKKEADHREAQEMKNIDNLISHAETVYAWTVVQEEEIRLQTFEKRLANEFEPAAEKARIAHENALKKADTVAGEVRAFSATLSETTERFKVGSVTFRETERAKKKVILDTERQKRKILEFDAEVQALQSHISKTNENMERARAAHFAGQQEKSRIIEELHRIDSEIIRAGASVKASQEEESRLEDERLPHQDAITRAQRDSERLRLDFEGKRREQMQLEAAARNKNDLRRFGDGFTELCKRVEQTRGFHCPPIGPIGAFVKMKDESWAPAVEVAIGARTLRTFIVKDSHDSDMLARCVPRGVRKPTILIANLNRRRYDIREHQVPDVRSLGHKRLEEIIAVGHDAVYNALVDQNQIERHVLNDLESDITQLGWSRIPNLHTVWNKKCDRAYTRNGSNTFRNGPRNMRAQMLVQDMRPYLQGLSADIATIEQEMSAEKSRIQTLNIELRRLGEAIRTVRQAAHQTQLEVGNLQRRKASLEDQLNQADNAFDTAPFEREIANYEDGIREQRAQKAEAETQIRDLEEARNRTEAEARAAADAMRQSKQEMTRATKDLDNAQNTLAILKSKGRQLKKDMEKTAEKLALATEAVDGQRERVVETMETARGFGECPGNVDPSKAPSEKCKQTVTALKQRLETEQERRGGRSAREIEMDYLRSLQQHEMNMAALKKVRFYAKALTKGLQHRVVNMRVLKKRAKKLVRAHFLAFLTFRRHEGRLTFGSEGGANTLHIYASMASHRKDDGELYETSDLRSLSGGEKSFTTLAFILALAELNQNPLRVMDEVDVFQDDTNRRASFKLLIDYCTTNLVSRQIIIITPLQLPNVTPSPKLKIVRLEAPRKGSAPGGGRQTQIDQYID